MTAYFFTTGIKNHWSTQPRIIPKIQIVQMCPATAPYFMRRKAPAPIGSRAKENQDTLTSRWHAWHFTTWYGARKFFRQSGIAGEEPQRGHRFTERTISCGMEDVAGLGQGFCRRDRRAGAGGSVF